jgi:hypothetical protein
MFIRVTIGRFDPQREANLRRWGEEQFLPALRQLPGFQGYHGGLDREAGHIVAVSLWETREHADALPERASATLGQLADLGIQMEAHQTFEETLSS